MINFIKKDITTITEGVIGHGCNASGGFGSGVAGAIKKKWPEVEKHYRQSFNDRRLFLGYCDAVTITDDLYVVNMITQQRYGYDGQRYASPEAIRDCMFFVCQLAETCNNQVYIPRIGCGLGGLIWEVDILPTLEEMEIEFPDVTINVCDL